MPLDYKIVNEPVTGEINITEHSQYNHIQADKVVVHSKVTARLFGHIKDVHLHEGSTLYMHGRINGSVTNEGGEIQLFDHSH